jgi:carboxypeptidase T
MAHKKAIWLPALLLVLALVGWSGPLSVADTLASEPTGPVVVRLYYTDQDHLNAVAGRLDIWEVHPEAGYALAAVNPDIYEWLQSLGYKLEIDDEKTALLGIQAPLDPRFYYFDEYYTNPDGLYIVDFLQETNEAHPDLTELIDIGNAWIGEFGGGHNRDIWVLRITNEDPAFGAIEEKPTFFLFANIHAREVATPELAIRYIRYLLDGYDGEGGYWQDPDATWLVDHSVLYVLVMQNPDGHWVDEQNTSEYRRKNMNDDECSYGDFGIDLNRNHSFFWGCCGGSSGDPCDETYRGTERASEPETQAFQSFFASVMLDQNGPNGDDEYPDAAPMDTTGIFLSLHSYSDLVLWPWDLPVPPPNEEEMTVIGRKLSYYTGYVPGSVGYPVDGSTDDWTYGKFGIPSYTFEVGSGGGSCGGFFPQYGCIDGIDGMARSFWSETKPAFLFMHKIARTPYITAYGPDTSDVLAVPGVVSPGTPVDLTAVVADHRYGGDPLQPIAAAEYFVGAPGEDGTGTAMSPVDGSWGDLNEAVMATLDTSSLEHGQHYMLVHGQNDNGDWGPFTAVFLYVMEEGVSPVIQGFVRDAGDNAPVEATVLAGTFQSYTDPDTGFYSMMVISGTYDLTAVASDYVTATIEGLEANNYDVISQDFYLYPYCDVFFDDVESGDLGWTADEPWAITEENSNSPTHSWTDSPGGDYDPNINISLTSPVLDLTDHHGTTLSFWHAYDLQDGWDHGYVEYSTDGVNWAQVAAFDGEHYPPLPWYYEEISLPGLDDASTARIRFRLQTGPYVQTDGWYVDDIVVFAGGPACAVPVPPEASFTADAEAGCPPLDVQFTDTSANYPTEWLWDFGDGVGTSTEQNPNYTFEDSGELVVTLTVSNVNGIDTTTGMIDVYDVPVAAFSFAPTVIYTDTVVQFTDQSTGPVSEWFWDFGDGGTATIPDPTHTFVTTGTFSVMLQVTSDVGCTDTTSQDLTVEEKPAQDQWPIYLPIVFRNG